MRGGAIRKNWRAARLILIYGHFDHHYIKMNNLRNIDKIDLAATVTVLFWITSGVMVWVS